LKITPTCRKTGLHRHKWNLVDLNEFDRNVAVAGQQAAIPPNSPPTNLVATNQSGTVHLSWTPSADPTVIGYVVRYGNHPGSYLNPTFVNGTSTTLTLPKGTYYITVSAYKAGKIESWGVSNEVQSMYLVQ